MNNPASTQAPGLLVQKSDTQASVPTIPPEKPKPWFAYDLPTANAAAPTQDPTPLAPVPTPTETAVVLPEKQRLFWSWNFKLVIDGEEWPPNKGHHFEEFHNDSGNVAAFLRRCDSWFDSAIPEYIEAHIRNYILKAVAKLAGPGEIPKTEVVVKLSYDIKVWTSGERPLQLKGTKEYVFKLDRQLRGHLMVVRWAYEHGIFKFVRAHFRHLAAGWIKRLPPSTVSENALKHIERELGQIFRPDFGAEDQLPPATHDIEIARPDNAD